MTITNYVRIPLAPRGLRGGTVQKTWFALGMQLAYIRVLIWVKMGNHPQTGPFAHYLVCCKAYVHPQRNVTHSMSSK